MIRLRAPNGRMSISQMKRYGRLSWLYSYRRLCGLTIQQITQLLKDKAVILRLREGTQEAGFLSSFCPISKYPTVVVIKYVGNSCGLKDSKLIGY